MAGFGFLIVFLFPVYWLIRDPLLAATYIVSWLIFFLTARRYECVRCIYFECPLNAAGMEIKNNFKKMHLKGNPKYLEDLKKSSKENFAQNFETVTFSKSCFLSEETSQISCSEVRELIFENNVPLQINCLKTKHEFKDFLYWSFVTLVLLSSAGIAIGIYSTNWLLAYILLAFFHFYVLEQRFFCTHCPYYSGDGKKVSCMMNWGWPKYFRPRPYPPGKFDLVITSLGFIIVIFFPLPWLFKEIFLLGAYLVSMLIFLLTIWKYECSQCIYFGCPFNRVPADLRKGFTEAKKTK
ncbi:MAG: hypothetical protein ACPK85_13665 [Methanosarcina sp.]